ncbi:uncharacterized protein Dwil_GK15617 [Drosophila willistoni]|uniref:Uncharacterized protein n=2 Tax=Drosophila willistoni TaxID=7260 RepID=B4MS75_DROWI|nr:uncharacterized protein Dwil_GK15617 [Drosophila willistoni]
MNATEGQGLVIKMAQKNKETQTMKLGGGCGIATPHPNWFAAAPISPPVRGYGTLVSPFTLAPPPSPVSPLSPHHRHLGHTACQFYMDREEELYRQACQLKGIGLETGNETENENEVRTEEEDSLGSEEEPPSKVIYRYTLDEMKSYNPYRSLKS